MTTRRHAARPTCIIRCCTLCFWADDGAACRFHDSEPVLPDTPLPPHREGCACWIEEIDPAPPADTTPP